MENILAATYSVRKASGWELLRLRNSLLKSSETETKSGPSEPVFITKILQEILENDGSILENIIFVNMGIIYQRRSSELGGNE